MNVLVSLCSCLVSEGLVSLLSSHGHQGIVGTHVRSIPDDFLPDVILVDTNTISQSLFTSFPKAKVLILDTGMEKEKIIAALLTFPTHGVLSIDTEAGLFKKALKVVDEGQIWVDNDTLKAFLHKGPSVKPAVKADDVTGREREIIDFVCQGYTNREIAASLSLSEHTVKAHLNRIFRKFKTTSRSKLVTLVHREKAK